MPLILGTNSIKDTGYNVANSLRFNEGSSDYLNRTFGTATNRLKLTISVWLKKSDLSTGLFWHSYNSGNYRFQFYFDGNDRLGLLNVDGGSNNVELITNRVFRDVSAYYHVQAVIDTTQGTASNRVKIYVGGVQETSFATETYPSQNADMSLGADSYSCQLGRYGGDSDYYSGYMCEVLYLDGQSLTPDGNTGEFDSDSGIWKPIDVSGLTFGDEGFYLDFENSGSLGADVSGNSNNFTVNNLTAIDQSTDTCTNNFATLNRLYLSASSLNFTEGNLTNNGNSSNEWRSIYATIGLTSGKWYFEIRVNKVKSSDLGNIAIGIVSEDQVVQTADNGKFFGTSRGYAYHSKTGKKLNNDDNEVGDTYGDTWTTVGDIIGCAIDLDNHKIYWRKNGTYQNSGNPESGATGTGSAFDLATGYTYLVAIATYYDDERYSFNFGSPPYSESGGNSDGNGYGNYAGSVPSGYYSLNTKNLAEFG